jgi:lipid-A-disaccharide synthase
VKYYLIAGEVSGDLHGANLMKAIQQRDPQAAFRFWGGDRMAAIGGAPVKHIRDLAFMGFVEVLFNIRIILGNLKFCKQDLIRFNPDVLICIDYPGFNMRIAEFAKSQNVKVVYYISPQIWAWKQNRAYKLKAIVDRMLTILPFEKAFYRKFDMEVDFVGHPLLDEIGKFEKEKEQTSISSKKYILLLPGSRRQEVQKMLPAMVRTATHFSNYDTVIAAAPGMDPAYLKSLCGNSKVQIISGKTYHLMQHAHVALVTSGTATLETGLWSTPMVVCYKGSSVSFLIAKRLIKVKYISLVNLILDAPVVPELIQRDFNVHSLSLNLEKLLSGPERTAQKEAFERLRQVLGGPGASDRAAAIISETIQ